MYPDRGALGDDRGTGRLSVIHGPAGCTHHNFSLLHATHLANDRLEVPPRLLSTRLTENGIIFGGEDALEETVAQALSLSPAAVFVLSTCIVETIGDDVAAICAKRRGVPVIPPVPTAGFLGGGVFETGGVTNALSSVASLAGPADEKPSRQT